MLHEGPCTGLQVRALGGHPVIVVCGLGARGWGDDERGGASGKSRLGTRPNPLQHGSGQSSRGRSAWLSVRKSLTISRPTGADSAAARCFSTQKTSQPRRSTAAVSLQSAGEEALPYIGGVVADG